MSHAKLSPSSAARWMRCSGSVQACEGLPDDGSAHAAEGTDAHELAALCLLSGESSFAHLGRTMGLGTVVDQDMAVHVDDYLSYVRGLHVLGSQASQLHVEVRLPIHAITGEKGAHGTADAIVVRNGVLDVIDLKFGRGVAVEAEGNEQLQIYALAALDELDAGGLALGIERVVMTIHQPRLGQVSQWEQTREELEDFREQALEAAALTREPDAMRNPSEKACRWCKARATCPALADQVQADVGSDFENLTTFEREHTEAAMLKRPAGYDADALGLALAAVDLVEIWCKAVRAEAERRLLEGAPVPGFKLVSGKRGIRRWSDEREAEQLLKAMRVKHDEMYDYSVISPTKAEKLAKAEVIGPRQWPRLQARITQADGKPTVAPASDPRPALHRAAAVNEFDDVSSNPADSATV